MSATVEMQMPATLAGRAWHWLVDANPVLAKEVLVTVRTRTYAGAIVVAPVLVAGLVLAIRAMVGRDPLDGHGTMQVYLVGLAVLLGALGAVLGATIVVQDREGGTIEGLRFSRVRPGSIIVAKFASIVLAQLAVVACTLPLVGYFVATTDVGFVEAALITAIAVAFGAMTAAIGVGISSLAPNIRIALVLSLLGAGLLGIGLCAWYGCVWDVGRDLVRDVGRDLGPCSSGHCGVADVARSAFERKYLSLFVVLPVCAFATVLWGGLAAGVSGLLDASEDRSGPIKGWALAALSMTALTVYETAIDEGARTRTAIAVLSLFAIAFTSIAMLFAFAGEPLSPSRRMRAQRSRSILRRLSPPSLVPSIAFTLLAAGLGLLGIPLLARSPELTVVGFWVFLYMSALGGFMGFIAASTSARRARGMGAVAAPAFLVALLQDHSHGATALDCVCPFWLGSPSAETLAVWSCSLALWALTACAMLGLMLGARRKVASLRG
jgi:hypothetical protein